MGAPSLVPDIELDLEAHERKELLRFVVVGSVDDGKSTLIGRLLYETQGLYEDQVAQVRRASKQAPGEIDFSLFTDGLRAEREQGITIDVAYRYFSTAHRKFIVADTPGHAQYTRNMATGASTAELGIILLDARLGVLPQSRRHAYIASLLGIPHLLVAVNKMDLVDFDEARFRQHAAVFQLFAAKLGFSSITYIPVSAKLGDNVVTSSSRMHWHRGGTILESLEAVPATHVDRAAPLRFPVQYVLRPNLDYRAFTGQVLSGTVCPGTEVVIQPSGRKARVLAVDSFEGELSEAFAPMSVALRLTEEIDVGRGDLIAGVEAPPTVATKLEAMLVWFGDQPFDPARAYLVKQTTRLVPAQELRVLWRLDLETLQETAARELAMNDIGRVSLEVKRPLVVDLYSRQTGTGAFIVIDAISNATMAAGMVVQIGELPATVSALPASRVGAEERRQRLGHRGGVVAIRGDGPEAKQLSAAVERSLFDAGIVATRVQAREVAFACAAAGLVAILVSPAESPPFETEGQLVVELPACTGVETARDQLVPFFGK